MINRTNSILALLLVALVAVSALVGVDDSRPNIEILPDMKYTPAWEAFAANPLLPDGRTMQPPVPGTIARGHLPLHYAATKEDAIRAGEELKNPTSISAIEAAVARELVAALAGGSPAHETAGGDGSPVVKALPDDEQTRRDATVRIRAAASVQRGGDDYRIFCVACHGVKGAGDGPVTKRGFPPPPSLLTGKSVQMKDGQLFHILTYGQGSMAPFAGQLARARRWDLVNYVRELQRNSPASSTDAALPPAAPVVEPAEQTPAEQVPAERPAGAGVTLSQPAAGDPAANTAVPDNSTEQAPGAPRDSRPDETKSADFTPTQ